jgi:hypothetical protein
MRYLRCDDLSIDRSLPDIYSTVEVQVNLLEIAFQLGGMRYRLTRRDVEDCMAGVAPKPTDKYYMIIGGRPYPPKQVLAEVLHLPSTSFTTAAASGILRRLGFEIQTFGGEPDRAKTESERLFESYLSASGIALFEFEPQFSNTSSRPDYAVTHPRGLLLFEVKEFQATPEDFISGGGAYDPYAPIREKIQQGRRKFREFKDEPCVLVIYNAGKPLVDLRWQMIYAAMLGNLSFSVPLCPPGEASFVKPELSFKYASGGGMHREKDGHFVDVQNTTISAIAVLELLDVGKRRFDLEVRTQEKMLGREVTCEEFMDMIDTARGTDQDLSLRQLRLITCRNPYARKPLPEDIFRGSYDEHYGVDGGKVARIFAGDGIQLLEREERSGVESSPRHHAGSARV